MRLTTHHDLAGRCKLCRYCKEVLRSFEDE